MEQLTVRPDLGLDQEQPMVAVLAVPVDLVDLVDLADQPEGCGTYERSTSDAHPGTRLPTGAGSRDSSLLIQMGAMVDSTAGNLTNSSTRRRPNSSLDNSLFSDIRPRATSSLDNRLTMVSVGKSSVCRSHRILSPSSAKQHAFQDAENLS